MNKILIIIAITLFNLSLFAQDTIVKTPPTPNVEIFDVVAVYRTHTDGRGKTRQFTSELKGKIVNYDESTGLLTFKGNDGRLYSFNSEQYEYFQYDKEFTLKKKKLKTLNPRKESGFDISAGISAGYININHNFTPDDYFVNGIDSDADIPISLKVGLSKYLNKNSLLGLTAEYALNNTESGYFNIGARYQYIYDPSKNAAFYFPIELKFSQNNLSYRFQTSDTTFTDDMSWTYPTDLETDVTLNAAELNIGQGVSFSMKNKRSLSLELTLLKQFILSEKFSNSTNTSPNSEFGITGLKLSVFMNF